VSAARPTNELTVGRLRSGLFERLLKGQPERLAEGGPVQAMEGAADTPESGVSGEVLTEWAAFG